MGEVANKLKQNAIESIEKAMESMLEVNDSLIKLEFVSGVKVRDLIEQVDVTAYNICKAHFELKKELGEK